MENQFTPEPVDAMDLTRNTPARMADKLSEKAVYVKDTVSDLGRQTVDSVDARRRPAAATLERTAAALHAQTDRAAGAAHTAADGLRSAADYLRTNDVRAMATDVGALIRRHPGQALLAAAVAGFVVARIVRR